MLYVFLFTCLLCKGRSISKCFPCVGSLLWCQVVHLHTDSVFVSGVGEGGGIRKGSVMEPVSISERTEYIIHIEKVKSWNILMRLRRNKNIRNTNILNR